MALFSNILQTIGNTPIVELKNIEKSLNLKGKLFAKLEKANPAGSAKDRIVVAMIDDALRRGIINNDTLIIEPTSGNTGIGLAMVCASKGYKLILTMPESMSIERRKILSAYGAKLILTDATLGMKGAINKANEIASENSNSFIPSQFSNMANPNIHYLTTGPEIYRDLDGNIDCFVAGVGTGGTISGVGKYLKEKNENIKIVAVEPLTSPVISKGIAGKHSIQGIGAGFIPDTLNVHILDEVICVSEEEAKECARLLATKEGILVGISSGAALYAATKIAKRNEYIGKNIVFVIVDSGERYLSSNLFE